jgi:hypothetical protein
MTDTTMLKRAIQRIRDALADAADVANSVGDGNEPSQTDKDNVSSWMDDAESELETIHDPSQSPSLSPPGAGSAQSPTIPGSRSQTCEDARDLAEEAETEAGKASPDCDYIGDRTRTLEASYLSAIRDKFGIE